MTLTNLAVLDQYAAEPFPATYPPGRRRFFVTVDQVQDAILHVVSSVSVSQTLSMYSLDSAPLVEQMVTNYHSIPGGMPTLITQDSSCYRTSEGTRVAKPFVDLIGAPNFRWAVGTSDKGNISHIKSFVGDGSFVISGSTNWSNMGMSEEDNEMEVSIDAALATQFTARVNGQYEWMMANCQQPSAEAPLTLLEKPADF